ncbi:MAG TPA: type I 3-dehydroquinate dehydratase [Desulfobulbaceae bacterium]|nr:type I 3-dehydroquinate dehydratase [Desulfobulbaceae bacterium]
MTVQPTTARPAGNICIAVALPDTLAAVRAAQPLLPDVDVVEIRLDAMRQPDIAGLCRQILRPLLFTNRPAWEGGAFEGQEEKRIEPLLAAVRCRAAFVDLELRADLSLRRCLLDKVRGSATRLIISHHDFARTPDAPQLSAILREQVQSGAHIGKIVTLAHDHLDVLRVLHLQCEARTRNFPLIAFCMGEAGRISRIVTLLLGGFMTYAALDASQATAPGQLTVQQLKAALSVLAGSA